MAKLQRGRIVTQTPEVSHLRELSRADLVVLNVKRDVSVLQSLSDSHHRVARAVAAGLSNAEVAHITGRSVNRISILKQDPAFRELVAHKRALIDVEFAAAADPVIELLQSVRTKSLAMIEDKISAAAEANEFLPSRDLATFAELGLDRTGYGKVQKNINVNADFAALLEAARKRSATARQPRQIEATALAGPEPRSLPEVNNAPRSEPQVAPSFRRL